METNYIPTETYYNIQTVNRFRQHDTENKYLVSVKYRKFYNFISSLYYEYHENGKFCTQRVDFKFVKDENPFSFNGHYEYTDLPDCVCLLDGMLTGDDSHIYEISDVITKETQTGKQQYVILSAGIYDDKCPDFYLSLPQFVSFDDEHYKFTKYLYNTKTNMVIESVFQDTPTEGGLINAYILPANGPKCFVNRLPKWSEQINEFIPCYRYEKI